MSVEMMKQSEDLWTKFVSTGKVEDYLKYRTEIRNSSSDTDLFDRERDDGRDSYIYRDGSDCITDKRIR